MPLHIEVGPRDVTNNQCRIVRRDNSEKQDVSVDGVDSYVEALLVQIQADMFQRAKAERDEKIVTVTEWRDFVPALNRNCLAMTPFCDEKEWPILLNGGISR